MTSKLHHQSLDRGITILELLAQKGDCSLADLHRLSGISKSSIRRLLATLTERRLVRRSVADGRYRSLTTLPVSAGEAVPARLAWVVDVAMPHVTALTKKVEWPSDVHLIAGDRMRILDSTRPLSPFHLYRGVVNRDVNLFGSASGMCCLAELGDEAFRRIAAHTRGDSVWGLERFRVSETQYLEHLRKTRERGYGCRVATFVGERLFDDGLAAIACPIYAGEKLMGAVSLLWPKNYVDTDSFASEFLGALRASTVQISDALSAQSAEQQIA